MKINGIMANQDVRIGKDIKMTFKAMKFHVKNPEEAEAVQKKLFELGYRWWIGPGDTCKYTYHVLFYANPEGSIGYGTNYDYFKNLNHEQVNVQEFFKVENNTMTTLEQQIKDTQEQLEKLTKALEEEKNKPKEWPQNGDEYWLIRPTGSVDNLIYCPDFFDTGCKAMHNCFKTKAEAEHYRDWLKNPVTHSRYLLQKVADEYNGDWKHVPRHNTGYFIYIDNGVPKVNWDCYSSCYGKIYFKDTVGCQKAIEVLGEETIKLACGIV